MAISALIEDLERQFRDNPRRVFARLAAEYRKSGDLGRAIDICRANVPQQPGYISGHVVLGQALYDSGQLDEAQSAFATAAELDPENPLALRYLGDIARVQGDTAAARTWYERLLDVDPQNEEATAQLRALPSAEPGQAEPAAAAQLGQDDGPMWGDIHPDAPSPDGEAEHAASTSPGPGAVSFVADAAAPGTGENTLEPLVPMPLVPMPLVPALDAGGPEVTEVAEAGSSAPLASDALAAPEWIAATWDDDGEMGPSAIEAEPLEAEPLEAEPLEAEPLEAEPLEAEPLLSVEDLAPDAPLASSGAAAPMNAAEEGWRASPTETGGEAASGPLGEVGRVAGSDVDALLDLDAGSDLDGGWDLDTGRRDEAEEPAPRIVPETDPFGFDARIELPPGDLLALPGEDVVELATLDDSGETAQAAGAAPPPFATETVPFATETMAELYLAQGHAAQALDIYRTLAAQRGGDEALLARIRALELSPGQAPTQGDALPMPAAAREREPSPEMAADGAGDTRGEAAVSVRAFLSELASRRARGAAHGGITGAGELTVPAAGDAVPRGLAALFGGTGVPPGDEAAAHAIAGAFSAPAPTGASAPVRGAARALDAAFRATGTPNGDGDAAGISFDQFFAAQGGGPAEPTASDLELFHAWLDGLRK